MAKDEARGDNHVTMGQVIDASHRFGKGNARVRATRKLKAINGSTRGSKLTNSFGGSVGMVIGSGIAGEAAGHKATKSWNKNRKTSYKQHRKLATRHNLAAAAVGLGGIGLSYHEMTKGRMSNTVYASVATAGISNAFGGAAKFHTQQADKRYKRNYGVSGRRK